MSSDLRAPADPRDPRSGVGFWGLTIVGLLVLMSVGIAWLGQSVRPAKAAPMKAEIVKLDDLKKALGEKRGQVVVLHLWATWCLPCLEELPLLGKFAERVRPRGVEVLSYSIDQVTAEIPARVSQLISDKARGALTRRIVRVDDPDTFVTAIDPSWEGTIPALFAYDHTGKLRGALTGDTALKELEPIVLGLVKEAKTKAP